MLTLETVIHLSQILGGKITDDGVKVAQKHLFGPDIWRKKKVERISVCTLLKRLICGHTIINDASLIEIGKSHDEKSVRRFLPTFLW